MATAFPFDPSGLSSANRITNEQHVITAQNFRDYHYVIPDFAPFFEKDFTIKLQYPNGDVRNLTIGVDYYFSNQFLDASRACAKPVYGSISFLDTDTAGILSISYNTVGGMWNITPQEITRILAEEMRNPRITSWEQVTYLPERFPVIDHVWDLVDMVGATEVVGAIEGVKDAILAASGGGLNEHINNYSNPHNTTKVQVGLGNVMDYPIATISEAQAGTSNGAYMTPARTKDAINQLAGTLVNAHAGRTDNPHATTKSHVGLGSVDNYATAVQAEAEAGLLNNKFMTPLRTAQAIAAQVGNNYHAHAANQLNPHNTTKDQVGLFNVQNYPVATDQEARAGTASDRYMTPQRTTQLVSEFVTVVLDGHAARLDNPHQVTKSQVGLGNVSNYAVATQTEARAGVSNTTFMTPGRTADAIIAQATPVAHLSDFNNPHQTTAAQVGAYTQTEIDTTLAGYVKRTDLWVAGMTKDAFIVETLSGTAYSSCRLEGKTLAEVVAMAQGSVVGSYAATSAIFSRDTDQTVNPVLNPYRWIKIGEVSAVTSDDTQSLVTLDVSYPDTYWFFSGGHKQESDAAANATASSPGYLVHAKNGLAPGRHSFDVTRLNGAADSDVRFGYTYDVGTNKMSVWARVACGYNDINIARLTSLGATTAVVDGNVIAEPAGITYATPSSFADATATNDAFTVVNQRLADLETIINSITVV